MVRYLMVVVAGVALGCTARAGGPPPVYVVVDRVVLEPSADAPERIRIEGSFVRVEELRGYRYGQPVEGFVYLSIEARKEKECRAEWALWQKAVGTGKVVAVGGCGEAGAFLDIKIRKLDERVSKPDAVYVPVFHKDAETVYVSGGLTTSDPVTALLAFAKAREKARKDGERR